METPTRQSRWHRIRYAGLPVIAIIRRELVSVLRLKRAFFLLLLLVGVMVLVIADLWPGTWTTWSEQANWARSFLLFCSIVLMFIGGLTVPALAGLSISTEEDKRTLDLIWGTGIGPFAFLFAKLSASLLFFLLFVLAVLPCFAVVYFLLGVDLWTLSAITILIFASVASIAAAGLWASCSFQRSLGALVASYFLMLFTQGALWLVLFTIGEMTELFDIIENMNEQDIAIFLPLFALVMAIVDQGSVASPILVLLQSAAFQCLLAVVFFAAAYWRVRRRLFRDVTVRHAGRRRWEVFTRARSGRVRHRRFGSGVLGIARLEAAQFLLPNGRISRVVQLILFFGAVVPVASLYFVRRGAAADWGYIYDLCLTISYFVAACLAALLAPLFVVGYRIRERQSGNEDALRMTLLGPSTVFFGKFLGGCLIAGVLLFTASMIDGVLWVPERAYRFEKVVHVLGISTVAFSALIAVSIALAAGAYLKEIGGALITSYITLLIVFFGLPLLFLAYKEPVSRLSYENAEWFYVVSPLTAFFDVTHATKENWPNINFWAWYPLVYVLICSFFVWLGHLRFAILWRRGS